MWKTAIILAAAFLGARSVTGCAASPPDGTKTRHQTAPAKELSLDLGNKTAMRLVLIPAGKFTMGSPEDEEGRRRDETQHEVTIADPFYMGVSHVTRAQFAAFVAETGYSTEAETRGWAWVMDPFSVKKNGASWKRPGFEQGPSHPVVCVSHNDALAFCKWVSERAGVATRLPTEAQWEYACRAGTTTAFNTGVTISTDQANYHGRYIYGKGKEGIIRGKTTPAGAFPPNQFGLFDMHGNARQWCSDTRGESWDSPSRPESVEKKPFFAARGGSWVNSPIASRAACRDAFLPDDRYDTLGFRIIVELDGPVAPSR